MKNGHVYTCALFIMDNGIFLPPACQKFVLPDRETGNQFGVIL